MIVDTNVMHVANGATEQASPECVMACVDRLAQVIDQERLVLDDAQHIFDEYPMPTQQPRAGHVFLKWIWTNRYNSELCTLVTIDPHEERGFEQFPDDDELAGFDQDDRKFVAVAVASGESPPIVNASDKDWWDHRDALSRHGVRIEFVCMDLMADDQRP